MKHLKKIAIGLALSIFFLWLYLYLNYTTPILMYHSFDKTRIKNYVAVDPLNFSRQMAFIKKSGYRVISLEDYCQMLKNNEKIPRNLVIITIDDGEKSDLLAIEILKKFDFPATVFLIWGRIGQDGYLSKEDIANFLKNTKINIGSHTLTHPDLDKLSDAELKEEISESKKRLETLFSAKIETFASPTGAFDARTLKQLREAGYLCACTTNRGFSRKLEPLALRRIKVTNDDNDFTLWAKLSGFYNVFKKLKKPY